jgi:signal transduction histidine kinase
VSEARVLVVDDDAALLEALPRALRLRIEDLRVDTCESAPAALERIQEVDYDAIVTDIKMPGMDGLALLAEIRKLRPGTPTLLITGHGERDLTIQALRGGAYDFIQKPIERDYFVASLTRAIEKRRLDGEIAEQRLALERHARVLEHVGDGVFLVDAEGLIRFWNAAARAITDLPADVVLDRPVGQALPGWDELARLVPVSRSPGAGLEAAKTIPFDLRGGELWLSISGVEFADGTVYAFRDVTAERMIDELKGEFIATVSHELRTPLAAIYGAAETLRQPNRRLEPGDRERLLAVIAQESDRLARVVNEILVAGHLDSRRLRLAEVQVDVGELARDVVAAMERHADDGVTFSLVRPPSLPTVSTDADKLRQVLINLVENAVKYSPEGGLVEVKLEPRSAHLAISVRDEGLGIATAEQRRIFDKFYRVHSGDRQRAGTGLGLAIARGFLEAQGGRIAAGNRADRSGAIFTIQLPIEESVSTTAGTAAANGG